MPSEHDPEASDEEMISSATLDCRDRGWKNMDKIPSYDFNSGSVQLYEKPINMISKGHAPSNVHYASSKITDSKQALKSYQKLKPIYIQPRDCFY